MDFSKIKSIIEETKGKTLSFINKVRGKSENSATNSNPENSSQPAADPNAATPATDANAATPPQPAADPNAATPPQPVADPNAAQQASAQQAVNSDAQQPLINNNDTELINKVYPTILDKVKSEFTNTLNGINPEKINQMDQQIQTVSKTLEEKQKMMEDTKQKIDGLEKKADQINIMLYELTTNTFNPFVKNEDKTPIEFPPEGQGAEGGVEGEVVQDTNSQGVQDPNAAADPNSQGVQDPNAAADPNSQGVQDPNAAADPNSQGVQDPNVAADPNSQGVQDPNVAADPNSQGVQDANVATDPNAQPQEGIQEVVSQPVQTDSLHVHDSITDNQENFSIPKQDDSNKDKFLKESMTIIPGIKTDHMTEKVYIEDTVDLPEKEGSSELHEKITLEKVWNDPDYKTKEIEPKIKKRDMKELFSKFMKENLDKSKLTSIANDLNSGLLEVENHFNRISKNINSKNSNKIGVKLKLRSIPNDIKLYKLTKDKRLLEKINNSIEELERYC